MGKDINEQTGITDNPTEGTGSKRRSRGQGSGGTQRRRQQNQGNESTSTAQGSEGTGDSANDQETRTSELALVEGEDTPNVPVPPAAPPRTQRATAPKKKKKPAAKVQSTLEATKTASTNLAQLIVAVSTVASMRLGDHWAISPQEAQAIADPAARIMARHNVVETMNAYSDYSALIIAVGVAVVPRVLTHQMQQPKGVKVQSERPTQPSNTPGNSEQRTENGAGDGQGDYYLSAGSEHSHGAGLNAKDFVTQVAPI